MFRIILIIISSFILFSCSPDLIKDDVEYGDLVFTAGYDGITSTDILRLYDNDVFEISLSDYNANGNYEIDGDTIVLNYFIANEILPKGYQLKGEHQSINSLIMKGGIWQEDSIGGLSVYSNKLDMIVEIQ
jgi:hypothetical protein